MDEDTPKIVSNLSKSDGDKSETKKIPMKFANNPKILNICQSNNAIKFSVAPPPPTSTTTFSNVLINPGVTSSLLKKLPGNISVSTQKVVVSSQQASVQAPASTPSQSLIPNKPVVVQPINPIATTNTTTPSVVCVNTLTKTIVLNSGDSRFMKFINPSESTTKTSQIPENKKVIVQRVEQIQPPMVKSVIPKGVTPPISPLKQNKVIVVSSASLTPSIQTTKNVSQPKDDAIIVNEMPPEMRNKAIIVSSSNPTGDSTQKIIKIPMQTKITTTTSSDQHKIAPVTITKKLLPFKPRPIEIVTGTKLPIAPILTKVDNEKPGKTRHFPYFIKILIF